MNTIVVFLDLSRRVGKFCPRANIGHLPTFPVMAYGVPVFHFELISGPHKKKESKKKKKEIFLNFHKNLYIATEKFKKNIPTNS